MMLTLELKVTHLFV